MNIKVGRPQIEDIDQIRKLYTITVKNNFKEEGILDTKEALAEEEIIALMKILDLDFESHGEREYHLIAKIQNQVVGTIAYGKANQIILENLANNIQETPEVKSVYILPEFQNKGIGSLLFKKILRRLSEKNIKGFYLDSGYKKAQYFWKKKLGDPICIIDNYWGIGSHHMIWHRSIN